jgi:hypothetical protein
LTLSAIVTNLQIYKLKFNLNLNLIKFTNLKNQSIGQRAIFRRHENPCRLTMWVYCIGTGGRGLKPFTKHPPSVKIFRSETLIISKFYQLNHSFVQDVAGFLKNLKFPF